MKNFFAGGFCGMSPRTGSIVGGLYMIVVCAMYSIFESGHLEEAYRCINVTEDASVKQKLSVILAYYYVALALGGITFVVCLLLIFSVFQKHFSGVVVFIIWIIAYEIANIALLSLTDVAMRKAKFNLRPIEWFGLSARLALDIFWLIFAVSFALEIYKTPSRFIRKRKAPKSKAKPPPKFKFKMATETDV